MTQKEFYNSTCWKWLRMYVLLYYSNDGKVQCSTCGKWYQLPDKLIQVGHFHKSDRHKSVALEFKNLAPQCYKCNVYFSGKPDVMAEWIERAHGKGTLEWLNIKKNNICKLDAFIMKQIAKEYKQKFEELVKIKGFNPWK